MAGWNTSKGNQGSIKYKRLSLSYNSHNKQGHIIK